MKLHRFCHLTIAFPSSTCCKPQTMQTRHYLATLREQVSEYCCPSLCQSSYGFKQILTVFFIIFLQNNLEFVHHIGFSQHRRHRNEMRGSFDFYHVIQADRGSLEPNWVGGNFSNLNVQSRWFENNLHNRVPIGQNTWCDLYLKL